MTVSHKTKKMKTIKEYWTRWTLNLKSNIHKSRKNCFMSHLAIVDKAVNFVYIQTKVIYTQVRVNVALY